MIVDDTPAEQPAEQTEYTPPAWEEMASAFTLPEYNIAPEDQHIANEIMAMDGIEDVPGPVTLVNKGGFKLPEPTLSALPPHLREPIERQLAMTPASRREETERDLVMKALRRNSAAVRGHMGVASTALPYHKAMAEIAREVNDASNEFDRVTAQLAEVVEYRVQTDPVTGASTPHPVLRYPFGSLQRKHLEAEQEQLNRQIKELVLPDGSPGFAAKRRMDKALFESVELRKHNAEEASILAEIEELSEKKVRQARIEAAAEIRTKHKLASISNGG